MDGSDEDLVARDVPVLATAEYFISGADRVKTIFASDSESDDDCRVG